MRKIIIFLLVVFSLFGIFIHITNNDYSGGGGSFGGAGAGGSW